MKLGIISDIHGDYQALTTVLDRLDNHHEVEDILCAGDLVGRGPQQEEVVKLIRKRDIPTVRGNHDDWAYHVSEGTATYLKNLPVDWRGNFGDTRIYMCHGKPGNNMWGLYRDHVSETLLNMMLASLKTDVLIAGHTHVPMYMRVEQGCVINPGSIFTFKNTRATSRTYGVLHLPEMRFDLFDVVAEPVKKVQIG